MTGGRPHVHHGVSKPSVGRIDQHHDCNENAKEPASPRAPPFGPHETRREASLQDLVGVAIRMRLIRFYAHDWTNIVEW